MEEKERYEVKRLNYSLNVKLTDNYEPDWRYIIFDDVNDNEFAKLETVCNFLNQQDKENQQLKQQLHDLPKKIVGDCKMALIKRINIISGYGRMTIDEQSFFLENEYGKDLDTILKKFGGENESKGDVGE